MSLLTGMPSDITCTILDFINIKDLTTFSFTSRISHNLSKDIIKKYKENVIFEVISFFTNQSQSRKKISLHANAYNKPKAAENVKKIFNYIPELFNFIEKFEIKELCFSGDNSVKFLWSIDEIVSVKQEVLPLLLQILQYINMNKTLKHVHLGLFSRYIEGNQVLKNQIEQIVHEHPTLISCEIRNISDTIWSSVIGKNLYKKTTGELVWQHIAPWMFLNYEHEGEEDEENEEDN